MAPGILVVGSINLDMVAIAPRIPGPGENVHARGFQMVAGGKGANQAVACHRLGSPTWLLACTGSDHFGDLLATRLEESGVSASMVRRAPGTATGVSLIVVEEGSGANTIVVDPGANMSLVPGDLDALDRYFEKAGSALFQLEIPVEVVREGARRARERGLVTILDAGPPRRLDTSVIERFDVVSPNERELAALTGREVSGMSSAAEAALELLEAGAGMVVVKMGSSGSLMVTGEGAWHFPSYNVRAVDTTGAGDAFTAGLTVALGEGMEPVRAAGFANAAGAVAVTVVGAQPSMPARQQVEALVGSQALEGRRL
jgi:ribokinase